MDKLWGQLVATYQKLDKHQKALLWTIPVLAIIAVISKMLSTDLSDFRDVAQGLAGLFTVIAIVVGGLWTYLVFVRTRERFPRARLSHQITHKPITNGKVLLRVVLNVDNQGGILLSLVAGHTWVQKMKPWPRWFLKALEDGEDPVDDSQIEVEWPIVARRNLKFEEGHIEIEPGEDDEFCFDFIVDESLETAVIYTHLENQRKRGRKIGWNKTSVYDFRGDQQEVQ